MRYVIDASVSARWFLPTVLSARAVQLRADYQNGVHELLAPETILWETCNALIKAERQSILFPGQAPLFFLRIFAHQHAAASLEDLHQRLCACRRTAGVARSEVLRSTPKGVSRYRAAGRAAGAIDIVHSSQREDGRWPDEPDDGQPTHDSEILNTAWALQVLLLDEGTLPLHER